MPLFGQELLLRSLAGPDTESTAYAQALARCRRLAGPEGIDAMLESHDVELLIAPTTAPAWLTDPVNGDYFLGSASKWAAVAGYPHLTVPMGAVFGLPVGMSLFGTRRSELALLTAGRAFEERRGPLPRPEFRPSLDDRPDIERALSGSAR